MKPADKQWLAFLLAAAVFIWLRDRSWIAAAEDSLPLLAALPLFFWLGAPWRLRNGPFALRRPPLVAAGLLFVVGVATNLVVLLAAAWTLALWAWLRERVESPDADVRLRLMVLPAMAFPWVTLDLAPLGWWFRLSAAWTAEHVFSGIGFTVTREGTHLLVQGLPIAVNPSCAGMTTLQALLIAGSAVAFLQLHRYRVYWWAVAALPLAAWLANTARVLVLTVAALSYGPEFAAGWFHTWGGWFVLMLMFGVCAAVFTMVRRWKEAQA